MSVSSATLQAHVDEVDGHLHVLPLNMTSRIACKPHLHALAESEGQGQASALSSVLLSAQRKLSGCQVCESSTQHGLEFVVLKKLDFASKHIIMTKGVFACQQCRAVHAPAHLLMLSQPSSSSR